MYTIKQPKEIIFGKNSCEEYTFPDNSLVITSNGAIKRGWIEYLGIKNYFLDGYEEKLIELRNRIEKVLINQ